MVAPALVMLLCAWPVRDPVRAHDESGDTWRLSSLERDAGWIVLFDGTATQGWRGYGSTGFPERGWEVDEGCLHRVPGEGGGDLVSERVFEDFELALEWKIAARGNSGIKYRVVEREDRPAALGPEYQVCDDAAPEIDRPEHSCGALYALWAPEGKSELALDRFHRTRIVVREGWIEHWLDGVRVVRARIGDEEWARRKAASKFKDVARFGEEAGHVLLQDHGSEVWFRRIQIRDLSQPVGAPVDLYDGESLDGWCAYGDARWTPEADGILGESGGGHHSFLVTEREFGDFVLEVEVKNEGPGNSGIQVRSQVRGDGRVEGYQIEIDPSSRAWSGGLYDEGRRGWLQDPEENDAGRAAFRPGEWNRFRIECIGPSIRAWVNGVPTADHLDAMDLSGVIGLQVHGGEDTRVRWRNFRLWSLGARSWMPMFDGGELEGWAVVGPDPHLGAGARMELVDGALRCSPSTDERKDCLLSTELEDLTLRFRWRDASGSLQLAMEVDDEYRTAWSITMRSSPAKRDSEIIFHVYPPRWSIDVDGAQVMDGDEAGHVLGKRVLLSWWHLVKPADLIGIEALGPPQID